MNRIIYMTTLLFFTYLVIADGRNDIQTIDSWEPSSPLILVSTSSEDDLNDFQCLQADTGIFGGERDISLELSGGEGAGRLLSVSVNGNHFNLATPSSTSGEVLIQYDGDDCSPELSMNGLNNADLTRKNGDSFHIVAVADHGIEIEIRVYAPDGSMASATITLLELDVIVPQEFFVPFSAFNGNIDFKNVGAIELFIDIEENIDLLINTFAISGKTRVKLIAPPLDTCDFQKGCCNDFVPKFPIVISSPSSTSSSSSTTAQNERDSFDFYDDYFTADTISSGSALGVAIVLSLVLLVL